MQSKWHRMRKGADKYKAAPFSHRDTEKVSTDKKRWTERAKSMSRVELLHKIVKLQELRQQQLTRPIEGEVSLQPQIDVYKEIAGVSHLGTLKANRTEISDSTPEPEDQKNPDFVKEYAKAKNREY